MYCRRDFDCGRIEEFYGVRGEQQRRIRDIDRESSDQSHMNQNTKEHFYNSIYRKKRMGRYLNDLIGGEAKIENEKVKDGMNAVGWEERNTRNQFKLRQSQERNRNIQEYNRIPKYLFSHSLLH